MAALASKQNKKRGSIYEPLSGVPTSAFSSPVLHSDGFRTVISLLEDGAQADAYDREAVERIGLEIKRIPIIDYGTPTLRDLKAFLREVADALSAGKVLVHCQFGYGRTGTMAAAYWVSKGLSADDAVKKVRLANPDAVETEGQISSLRKLAASVRRDWDLSDLRARALSWQSEGREADPFRIWGWAS